MLNSAKHLVFCRSAYHYSYTMTKPAILFVLGGPGAGKGTQCEKIVKEFGYIHLSAGDLLREERNSGSKDGDLIDNYIKEGKIVPVEITVGLLEKAMERNSTKKFLIDGFPRNENNLEGWNKIMSDKIDLKGVIFFDCPEEVCVKRIMQRSLSSGRADDNETSLRKRLLMLTLCSMVLLLTVARVLVSAFQTYYNQTMPIIDHYEQKGLVKKVSAVPPPDEVFEEVKLLMKSL